MDNSRGSTLDIKLTGDTRMRTVAGLDHPWSGPLLKTGWGAKADLQVTLVASGLVAEISADVARASRAGGDT